MISISLLLLLDGKFVWKETGLITLTEKSSVTSRRSQCNVRYGLEIFSPHQPPDNSVLAGVVGKGVEGGGAILGMSNNEVLRWRVTVSETSACGDRRRHRRPDAGGGRPTQAALH